MVPKVSGFPWLWALLGLQAKEKLTCHIQSLHGHQKCCGDERSFSMGKQEDLLDFRRKMAQLDPKMSRMAE